MPANSIVDKSGGLEFPLNATDFTNTLAPLDPARARMMALFSTAIAYELSEVWAKVTATLSPKHPLFGTTPIEDKLELRPSLSVMQQRKAKFPLMCLHRTGRAEWEAYTFEIDRRVQDWSLLYILPALDVHDQRKLGDVLQAIPVIVRRVIRNHGHPAFENGRLQFFQDESGIGGIRLSAQTDIGNAPFSDAADAPQYFTIVCELQTVEYSQDRPDEFPEFEGVDYVVGAGDAEEVIPRFIEASDDVPVKNE